MLQLYLTTQNLRHAELVEASPAPQRSFRRGQRPAGETRSAALDTLGMTTRSA